MFEKVLALVRRRPDSACEMTYEEARDILEQENQQAKLELAEREDVEPEILYYLATDDSADIRRRIAGNPATPHHADRILAADNNDDVRCELARKISRLLPDLDPDSQATLMERTIIVLDMLAQDQLPRVRQIIAEELKATVKAPKHIIRKLAEDQVLEVCAPVLEYSPLLSDEDLREIIAFTRVKGALTAIARRQNISESVADAIAASLDVPAVAALLANESAQIREETLDAIVDNAADITDWHESLVRRPNLSIRLMRRIASFVASSLINVMIEENDLGAGDGAALLGRVRERIADEQVDAEEQQSVAAVVADLHDRGLLDDGFVMEAVEKGQRDVVMHVLSVLTGIDFDDVRDIVQRKNARRITALAWRAGLSMRTAFRIQKDVAKIPPKELINARNGFDYPLSEGQMQGLLEPYF
ncbi:MAG: DUF2336 domain-containing protein [Alphaproteobacteria bacterium]|nr:MAG: DUF2336 domain-containing protein [Alphaproteobacteria bacterium]